MNEETSIAENTALNLQNLIKKAFDEIQELEKKLRELEPEEETETLQEASELYYQQLADLQKEDITTDEYEARREELFKPVEEAIADRDNARSDEYRKTKTRLSFMLEEIARIFQRTYEESVNDFIKDAGDDPQ